MLEATLELAAVGLSASTGNDHPSSSVTRHLSLVMRKRRKGGRRIFFVGSSLPPLTWPISTTVVRQVQSGTPSGVSDRSHTTSCGHSKLLIPSRRLHVHGC